MNTRTMVKTYALSFAVMLATGSTVIGCTQKDLYDSDYGKTDLPSPGELPSFATRSGVNLAVDYEMAGLTTLISVYTEYPYEKREDGSVVAKKMEAAFKAFTDGNGKFNGTMNLPTAVKKVYLCTNTLSLPRCVELEVTATGVSFQLSDSEKVATRSQGPTGSLVFPARMGKEHLFTLCDWADRFGTPKNTDYITINQAVTPEWLARLQQTLWKGPVKREGLNNSALLVEEKYTNVSIPQRYLDKADGLWKTVTEAEVLVTFLEEAGWYQSTLGYYYYPTSQKPDDTSKLNKYILYPNASTTGNYPFNGQIYPSNLAPLKSKSQVRLKYVDGAGVAHDKFPPDYTIGWFLIPEGFVPTKTPGEINVDKAYYYSNESWNANGKRRCIALNDQATGRVIVGFEDGADQSCEDVLFFVDSNPAGIFIDPDKPSVEPGVPEIKEETVTTFGTFAFEDRWPARGDYDMNDVVVEYSCAVTFNSLNKITKIVDTFESKQPEGSAALSSAFAYQVDAAQVGKYELTPGAIYEEATHSFVVFPNAKDALNQVVTVTRTFDNLNMKDLRAYNPFIIVNYVAGASNRTEVHLPKHASTGMANKGLNNTGEDRYYVDINGKHPFAIELPVIGFGLVTEGQAIGTKGQYASFANWVENGCGSVHGDWYLHR